MSDNITLEFEQTMEDLIALSEFVRNDVSSFKRIRNRIYKILAIVIVLINIVLVVGFNALLETYNIVFCVIIFLYFFVLKTKWFSAFWVKQKYSKKGYEAFFGKRTLVLREDALLAETSTIHSKYAWNSFIYFKEDKQHLFVFLARNQAIIIPKRIFLLDQEEYDVKSFIERKLAENKK